LVVQRAAVLAVLAAAQVGSLVLAVALAPGSVLVQSSV